MASFSVSAGTTQTARINMVGTDTLTVQSGGVLVVTANAQSVRFNGVTTAGLIQNDGAIINNASGGRAIRFETSVGTTVVATINNGATGIISSPDDAIQIQAGSVTAGQIIINNAAGGSITSATGQAVDFAGGIGTFIAEINNFGTIAGATNDGIRIGDKDNGGGVGNITNHGIINGGIASVNSGKVDGINFGIGTTGTVRNFDDLGGSISGDRHGITAGENSDITIYNGDATNGGVITGRNGSGIGSDGSATVYNYGIITGGFTPGSDVNGHTPGQNDGGGPDGIDDGDGDGIDIDFLAYIENFGIIRGIGAAGNGSDGLPNTSEGIAAGGGTIINHVGAEITGLGLGILIDDSSQGNAYYVTHIVNDGSIIGTQSYAIRIVSALNDTIENSGTISGGGGSAIAFGSGQNTLKIHAGSTIVGNSDGGAGTDTLDYSALAGGGVTVNFLTGTATGTGGVSAFENVIGTALDDVFVASGSGARFDGGLGLDTVTFDFRLVDVTVTYAGNTVTIVGRSGDTVLTGIEKFVFTDGIVNIADGSPLIDDLFYFARNHDVWNAHMDADAHYAQYGWREGRDPNAFFSSTIYLSEHPEVKAAGTDPLVHFDQVGWKSGLAPSLTFDPAAYLEANPDVKAAGVDPLAHFLLWGAQEGRQAIAPTSIFASNGFDYVYYLQNNPDVAAANVDPLAHFMTYGWKEGRNPNALFDTAGYLATYTDVAAAGVNPLDHYNEYGWKEGRDPSVDFDTTDYISAYTDVAAAQANPLLHYLVYGQHEGRSAFADSMWG